MIALPWMLKTSWSHAISIISCVIPIDHDVSFDSNSSLVDASLASSDAIMSFLRCQPPLARTSFSISCVILSRPWHSSTVACRSFFDAKNGILRCYLGVQLIKTKAKRLNEIRHANNRTANPECVNSRHVVCKWLHLFFAYDN
jgi:hypothetical protein